MTAEYADWIVVGAGGAGCAVSQALSRRGWRVVTLERHELNHDRGSSHGRTRILRTAYSEGRQYVPLVLRARLLWTRLARDAGVQLFAPTGVLVVGPPDGRIVSGAIESVRGAHLPHGVLNAAEAAHRFPAFRLAPEETAVWDPKGGVLFPEAALSSLVRMAEANRARFFWHTSARRWAAGADEVVVRTGRERFRARGLVLAAGAWTSELAPDLRLPLQVERQTVFWYRPPRSVRRRFREMPAFVWQRHGEGYFYGTPDLGDGVKVASDVGRPVLRPSIASRAKGVRERRLVEGFMDAHLPLARGPLVRSVNCFYTNTPDHNFVVDFHPRHPNVIIVSACSGHGFKFVPALGEAVARMVETGNRSEGWESFRLDRSALRDAAGKV